MRKTTTTVIGSRIFAAVLVFFLVVQTGTLGVVAAPRAIKVSPLILRYSLKRGQKDTGIISAINPNRFPIRIKTETEDFIQGDEAGTPQFIPKGAEVRGLASWIKFKEKEFSLDPLETKDVSFQVNAPKDAEPGGHYAAVFLKALPAKSSGQNTIGISGRVGTLLLVTVPGEVKQTGKIVEFIGPRFVNSGPVEFLVRYRNTGSVHYQPKGDIKISSMFNPNVKSLAVDAHFILPKSIRQYKNQWTTGYGFGIYKADLEIKTPEGKILEKSLSFFMFPWQQTLLILGGLLLLYWAKNSFTKKFQIVRKD